MLKPSDGESPLETLHRLSRRYRARETFYNEHYRDLCSRNDPTVCITFQRPIESRCIHVHRRTKFIVLSTLIRVATVTRRYTLDVQFDIDPCPWLKKNNVVPALLQIEFHLTEASPLVLLIEVAHVPTNKRKRRAIQLLCAKIFSPSNHIYTWKPWSNQLDGFRRCALLDLCDLTALNMYDVAQSFTEWYTMAFPRSRLSGETAYSLQTAIFLTFAEWLDTSVQYAPWSCGIDVDVTKIDQTNLNRMEEQRELRRRMQDYALNNCFAISRLLILLSSDASALESIGRSCRTIVHQKRQKRNKATTASHRHESSNFYLRPTLETVV